MTTPEHAEKVLLRSEIAPEYTWNAPSVFPDQAAWQAEMEALRGEVNTFAAYQGRMQAGPAQTLEVLKARDELMKRVAVATMYARMSVEVDKTNAQSVAMAGQAESLEGQARGAIAFIGLSTACPKPPLMATGTVGEAQLSRLPALLRQTREEGLFRVLYLHHCPLPGREKWRKRLTDAPQVQGLLEEHGAELVLHGHGHRAHFTDLQTRHGNLPVIAVPSASALGLHGADIAQYNRYQVERTAAGWQLRIESRCYEAGSKRFVEASARTLQISRD